MMGAAGTELSPARFVERVLHEWRNRRIDAFVFAGGE